MRPLELVKATHPEPSKLAQAERALEGFRKKLAELEATRADVESSIPGLFELGGEAAAERERARLPELETKVAKARDTVRLAEQAVESHKGRAKEAELAELRKQSDSRATALVNLGGVLQVALQELIAAMGKVQEADKQFLVSMGPWSNVAITQQFHMTIFERLEKAIYGLTGKGRPVPMLGPQDVRDQGAHDFSLMTKEYVDMAFREAAQRLKQ